MMKRSFLSLFSLFVFVVTTYAQTVPRNEVAEFTFERGLELYRAQEYNLAYQRFMRVMNDFPLNQKTTAAMLMAARALYSQGLSKECVDLTDKLMTTYPDSRYAAEAKRLKDLALQGSTGSGFQPSVVNVGVALPLRQSDAFVRAMFNGIRLAVDEYNNTRPATQVRLVFRDSGGEAETAVAALTSMIREGKTNVVIGPLFSQEAISAAEIAERSQIVMIAPVATDSRVSDGRRYIFQASSTFPMRGRLMARYAVSDLGFKNVGLLYESNSNNEATIQAFDAEARRLGATVVFSKALAASTEWSRLSRNVGAAELGRANAVYMPINGRDAQRAIEAALNGLDQMRATTVTLGNSDWHDLPNADQASRYRTAYTSDFWAPASDPRVREFIRRYQALTNQQPDQLGLAYTGYDLMRYLISLIQANPNASLQQLMRDALPYYGLARRFDFRNGNQNEAAFYLRYRNGEIILDK